MKYHTLFYSKIGKDVRKIVVCCSRDWHFKGLNVKYMWSHLQRFRAVVSNGDVVSNK